MNAARSVGGPASPPFLDAMVGRDRHRPYLNALADRDELKRTEGLAQLSPSKTWVVEDRKENSTFSIRLSPSSVECVCEPGWGPTSAIMTRGRGRLYGGPDNEGGKASAFFGDLLCPPNWRERLCARIRGIYSLDAGPIRRYVTHTLAGEPP